MSFCQWDCRFGTWAPTVPSSVPPSTFPAARPAVPSCHAILPVGISVETVSLEACPDPPPSQCCGLGLLHFSSYVIVTLYLLILHITNMTKEAGLLSPSMTCVSTVLTMSPGMNLDPIKVLWITGQSPATSPVFAFFFSDCIAGRFWTHSRASDSASGLHYSLVPWQRTPALTP